MGYFSSKPASLGFCTLCSTTGRQQILFCSCCCSNPKAFKIPASSSLPYPFRTGQGKIKSRLSGPFQGFPLVRSKRWVFSAHLLLTCLKVLLNDTEFSVLGSFPSPLNLENSCLSTPLSQPSLEGNC